MSRAVADLGGKNEEKRISGAVMRKASIKETGEELSPAEWARFDAAIARLKAERAADDRQRGDLASPRETEPERQKGAAVG